MPILFASVSFAQETRAAREENPRQTANRPSLADLVKRFDEDGDGNLNEEEGRAARRARAAGGRETPRADERDQSAKKKR